MFVIRPTLRTIPPRLNSTGNHSFCSKGCAGTDEFAIAEGDPDGEMLTNSPAEGGGFFVEVTGDVGGTAEGGDDDDNAEGEGDGEGEVGGQGAVVSAVDSKPTPKVTLGECKGSAQTVPSLLKTLGVCKEMFKTKEGAFHQAERRVQAVEATAREGAAAAAASDPFEELKLAIDQVKSICEEGQYIIHKTLEAVDDAVSDFNPVSD